MKVDLKRPGTLFWVIVIAWTVLHVVLAATLQVSGDEAYYWDCARHLDWAYYDQPGLMIWPIALFRHVLGDTPLAVRAPALLASFLIALFMRGLVRRLGGNDRQAAGAYSLLHLMPAFFLGSFYESTDIGLAAAYLAATWAAVAIAQGERRAWWGFGAATGLGFIAKFPIVIVLPVIAVALLGDRARKDLRTPTPWLAAAMSLALTLPVWIWAAGHDWDNIYFQAMGRVHSSGLDLRTFGEFAGSSFALMTPFLAIVAIIALVRLAAERTVDRWIVVTAAVLPFAFFGVISLTSRVGAHWGGPGMVVAAVAVAVVPVRGRRWWIAAAAVFGLTLSLAVVTVVLFPDAVMNLRWSYAGNPSRINTGQLAHVLGNEEMTAELERRFGDQLLLMTGYTDTHLFAFLSESRLHTRLANLGRGKHGLASLYWYRADDLVGRDAVIVTSKGRLAKLLPTYCTEVDELEPLTFEYKGKVVRELLLYRCRGLTRDGGAFGLLR